MDSLAPSPTIIDLPTSMASINSFVPTRVDGSSPATGVDSASPTIDIDIALPTIDIDIDIASPTININIDATSPTIIGITSLAIVDIASPTIGMLYSPTIINSAPMVAIDTPVMTVIDPISCLTGSPSIRIRGFEMTFGLFNFHVDDDVTAELISIIDPATPTADLDTLLVVKSIPSTTTPPMSAKVDAMLETLTPSVRSNDFQDPPPSPTTAYCVECDAYHFVGIGDFSHREITGCEDPRGRTAAIYPTISECERALNALTLQPTPYDPDYVEGLYSD
jgi:hypothetical protein